MNAGIPINAGPAGQGYSSSSGTITTTSPWYTSPLFGNITFGSEIKAEFVEDPMALTTRCLEDNETNLYLVLIVDKTVGGDEAAIERYYVRARTQEQAKIKAILRDHISEDTLDDYTFIIKHEGIVGKYEEADEDAE